MKCILSQQEAFRIFLLGIFKSSKLKFINFYLEPVGFKGPAFSTDASTFSIRWDESSTLALLCQAQGYPVPIQR